MRSFVKKKKKNHQHIDQFEIFGGHFGILLVFEGHFLHNLFAPSHNLIKVRNNIEFNQTVDFHIIHQI